MTCPFLKETQVKFCQLAGVRTLIPLGGEAVEKCTTAAFGTCPVYRDNVQETAAAARCPWLQESLMQHCGAAPVVRMVPYSESMLSRCGNGAFRYCDLYHGLAHPEVNVNEVDGVPMPGWLRYSSNHMWLDANGDGHCHIGIDGFLARALGKVEQVSYVWFRGRRHPAAMLTANGVDLPVVFPNRLMLNSCNLYLRADPGRLTSAPYTAGWLFEGMLLPESGDGLMEGETAREWMSGEHGRINEFIHEHFIPEGVSGDGGVISEGLMRQLEREQAVGLFHEFFSPFANKREL